MLTSYRRPLKYLLSRYITHISFSSISTQYRSQSLDPINISIMAKWHDLPPEIHAEIFHQLCIDLISDFTLILSLEGRTYVSSKNVRPGPVIAGDEEEYEVERIDGERVNARGGKEYLVKWYGYPDNERTWEPLDNLEHAEEVIMQWRERTPKAAHKGSWQSKPQNAARSRKTTQSHNSILIEKLHAPVYLTTFASAIRTCHYFHDALSTQIKLDGKFVGDILHDLQYRVIRSICLGLHARKFEEQSLDFESIFSVAGCFWRNSEVCDRISYTRNISLGENDLLGQLLIDCLNPRSRLILLPHLKGWFQQHTRRCSGGEVIHSRHIYPEFGPNGTLVNPSHNISVTTGRNAVLGHYCLFTSIAKLNLEEEDGHLEEFQQDLKRSGTNGWLLLMPENSGFHQYESYVHVARRWTLVNYKLRRMYNGPEMVGYFMWNNVWDVQKLS